MNQLKIGDKAPDFDLPDAENEKKSLASFLGNKTIIYFYPKDNTPGCTMEAINFSNSISDFKKEKVTIIGISPDSCSSHANFIKKHNLTIILLSDPEHKIIEKYGQWVLKKNYGKEYMGVNRSTFLIDKKGHISWIWQKVKVDGHAEEVLKKIKEEK